MPVAPFCLPSLGSAPVDDPRGRDGTAQPDCRKWSDASRRDAPPDTDLLIGTFGHAGDGNLHPTCVVDPDEPTALERVEAAFAEIFAAALDLGGTVTGEHGIGLAKKRFLADQLGESQVALLRRIKTAFDPAGILNPGKLGS